MYFLKKNIKIQFNNILNFNLIYYFRVIIICQMIEIKKYRQKIKWFKLFCLNEFF